MRRSFSPARVGEDSDWQSVAVGGAHTCAIKRNRRLFCWGRNSEGQLAATPSADPVGSPMAVNPGSRYSTVALGWQHSCALDTGQTLYCWGANDEGQLGVGDSNARYAPALVE